MTHEQWVDFAKAARERIERAASADELAEISVELVHANRETIETVRANAIEFQQLAGELAKVMLDAAARIDSASRN